MRNSTRLVVLGKKLWTFANTTTALWGDFDDISTITFNSNTIAGFQDKSGNGRHFAQNTTASQPTYISSGINNKGVAAFDGANDVLSTNYSINGLSNVHIFVVGSTSVSGFVVYASTDYSANGVFLAQSSTLNSYILDGRPMQLSGGTYLRSSLSPIIAGANILQGRVSTDGMQVSVNGIPGSTVSYSSSQIFSGTRFLLGSIDGTNFYNLRIAEVAVIEGALSFQNEQRIQGYLAHKWGLSAKLATDHPFRFTPPLA